MKIQMLKKIVLVAAVAASASAIAGPLSQYNIMLSEDFAVSGGSGHIEGKAFIGGDVVKGSIYAQYEDKFTTEDTLKVVGNFNVTGDVHVEAGYVAYGGTTNATNTICNGLAADIQANGCLKKVTDNSLVTEKASLFAELQAESAFYKALTTSAGASTSGDSNSSTFTYVGPATELAVFNISAYDLANTNWSFDFGLASNVVINVSGSSYAAAGGKSHVNDLSNPAEFNHVLWNFADATSLTFGDSWYGSVLALNADIFTPSNLNGAIAAKSYQGNGEIHLGHYDYTPPTKVSEPSTLLLGMLGLGLLALGRIRHKQ